MKKLTEKLFREGVFEVYSDQPNFDKLVQVHQIHSNIVVEFKGDDLSRVEADGIVMSLTDLNAGHIPAIKTADCLPILFIGKSKIALVHAGWRGIKNEILLSPLIREMDPQNIFIGPSIYTYEVQEDFRSNFPKSQHFKRENDHLYFNLQQAALEQLSFAYPKNNILESRICTFENSQYNSYRRNNTNIRNWNIFRINS